MSASQIPDGSEPIVTALQFVCPNCQSPAGRDCTQPTNTSRVAVKWFHSARVDQATEWNQQVFG